jgi:hypothetical protein
MAAIEVRQSGDNRAELRCRQAKASAPPNCAPRQFTMKSRRQVNLIAFCCSGVGIAAGAVAAAGAAAAGVAGALLPSAAIAFRHFGES